VGIVEFTEGLSHGFLFAQNHLRIVKLIALFSNLIRHGVGQLPRNVVSTSTSTCSLEARWEMISFIDQTTHAPGVSLADSGQPSRVLITVSYPYFNISTAFMGCSLLSV
jgi:hypothetical protein